MTRTIIYSGADKKGSATRAARAAAKRLAQAITYAVGSECPECGSRDTEDNGASEYRCCACDHRWGFEYGERYGF